MASESEKKQSAINSNNSTIAIIIQLSSKDFWLAVLTARQIKL
jgi:hypothetical protein